MFQVWSPRQVLQSWARFKQGVMTFAWRPGSQCDVAGARGADSVLASDCRAQCGRPSIRRGFRICVTVRLPVGPRAENNVFGKQMRTPPLWVTTLLNVPDSRAPYRFHPSPNTRRILEAMRSPNVCKTFRNLRA